MASPITTEGFRVQAQPGINYLDPRLLAPAYSDLVPAIGRGLGVGNQVIQIAEDARMRPYREQLAQLQVQNQQNELGMAPLMRDLRLAQIAEAQQNAATPRIIPGDTQIIDETQFYPAALDEFGSPTGEGERVVGDLIQIQNQREVGPGGVITNRQVRGTIKTAAQRELDDRIAQANIDYRNTLAEAATLRAENDRIKADAARARAEAIQNNPSVGFVDVKKNDGKTYRQYFAKADPTRIIHEVDRGEIGGDIINFGGLTVQPRSAAPVADTGIDPDIAALAGLGTALPAAGAVRVTTKAERDALPVGTRYIGPDGREYTKK